jgi:hypothetical protein
LASVSLVACSAEEDQQVTEDLYCATADGTIVDEDLCERDSSSGGSSYFIWYGSYGGSSHPVGHKLSGGNRFPYNDTAQRKNLGLPEKGKVIGKSGGLGKSITRTIPGSGAKSSGGKAGGMGGSGSSGG